MPLLSQKFIDEYKYNIEHDIVINENIPLNSPAQEAAIYAAKKLDIEDSYQGEDEEPRFIG